MEDYNIFLKKILLQQKILTKVDKISWRIVHATVKYMRTKTHFYPLDRSILRIQIFGPYVIFNSPLSKQA